MPHTHMKTDRRCASVPAPDGSFVISRSITSVVLLLLFASALLLTGCASARPGSRSSADGSPATDPGRFTPQDVLDPVEAVLDRMSLDERIGQRFIMWMPGRELTPDIRQALIAGNPAGMIIYKWNHESMEDARQLIGELRETSRQAHSGLDLLICADQEGGRVNAFRYSSMTQFPGAWYWGSYNDMEYVRSAAYIVSTEMKALGLNMNLAPVLDLYGKPDDSIIGDRALGSNPQQVASFAHAYLAGSKAAGMITVAKHFPGHGASRVDSHFMLPVVELSDRELIETQLMPFRAAIAGGVDAIMTAHILYPNIDPVYPATISRTILRDILRRRLGFDGVIITDSLEMGALREHFSLEDTLLAAFRAGVDLVLLTHKYQLLEMIETVKELRTRGLLSDREIDEGVRRVLRLKAKYGLLGFAADRYDPVAADRVLASSSPELK